MVDKLRDPRDRAAYQATRRRQATTLYFRSVEDLAAHKAAAEEAGYSNFNAWLLQMIANATSGSVFPPEYVEGLKKEVEKLRSRLAVARDEANEYHRDVNALQAETDVLLTLLRGAVERPEGRGEA